ncbi:hypothetical protein [Jiangella asiatica]|uniref:Uncharacterized protein n=1 Tax=Jiangella asiatica TaxID=2530372 RepID=A0A4R5D6J2_9ACTN|nr:hypothetical protein [Jiangella asiatica]TDE09079.1 hypothetical protein E1269_15290 [Jiangella asiatica]
MATDETGGPIRRSLDGLLDALLAYDRASADVLATTRRDAERVAKALSAAGPDGAALADQVMELVAAGVAAAGEELAVATEAFASETGALSDLLAEPPASGASPGPVPAQATTSGEDAGQAEDEAVDDALADEELLERQSSADAERAPTSSTVPDHVREAYGALFDAAIRDDIMAMVVTNDAGHAIQLHGPDVSDEALKARVSWKKDPMGRTDPKNDWRRDPDGSVHSKHGVGHVAGKFTSLEALAKPLRTLLDHCGGTIADLHDYLERNRGLRDAMIFVPAEDANLVPGDTTAYRGEGTQAEETAEQWRMQRRDAMELGGEPVPIVRTDPIARGMDPGVTMIFRKIDRTWVMITCYPEAEPRPSSSRWEERIRDGSDARL